MAARNSPHSHVHSIGVYYYGPASPLIADGGEIPPVPSFVPLSITVLALLPRPQDEFGSPGVIPAIFDVTNGDDLEIKLP